MDTQRLSDIATEFLRMAAAGDVREAYARHVSEAFVHHNPYFPADREALATILASDETAGPWRDVSKGGDIGFSFIRGDSEPESARRDLGLAIEALAATAEIEAAFAAAQQRLIAGDDAAFGEQQRLHGLREAMKERLAHLASNE